MIRKLWLVMLAAALVVLAAGSAFAQYIPYTISYFGDVDPTAPGSCGISLADEFGALQAYQWQLSAGNPALGEVIADPDAIDGWAYRINDNTAADQLLWRTNSTNLDSTHGATIVARVKTVSETDSGGNFGIQGSGMGSQYHWGGPNGHVKEAIRGNETTVAGDGAYHILRVTAAGTGVKPTAGWVETFPYADSNLNDNGDWDGTAAGEIAVVGNTAQVTGGRNTNSARPVLCDPDANGKITVIVKSKAGVTGPIEPGGWVYSLFAVDGAGNTMGGWQGNCFNQTKGRVGGVSTGLQDLKTDGTWSELKMVIDCSTDPKMCEYFVDGVSIGTLPYTVANLSAPGVNQLASLKFDSFNDSRTLNYTVLFDDLEIQGTAVSGRTVKMYFDENPNPVVTIPDASNQGGTDSFLMGAASTAGLQDVYFDYVIGTAAGAFAPGEEAAVIGYPLPMDPTPCTSIAEAKVAPPNKLVTLTNVIVTAVFYEYNSSEETVQAGFAVEDVQDTLDGGYKRVGPNGIRVSSPGFNYAGQTVDLVGFVKVENGEPVLYARQVIESGFKDPPLVGLGMNNRNSGGQFLPGSFSDAFAYANGSLAGKGGWTGSVSPRVAVSTGAVRVAGGWQSPETATRSLALASPAGDVQVRISIKQGVGTDNFWDVYARDAAGNDLAHWYGKGNVVTVKTGPTTKVDRNLTGGWDELTAVISGSSTAFSFNGSPMATAAHSGSPAVAKVEVSRNGRGLVTDYVEFDNLVVSQPTAINGVPTLGLYSTIFGKVTGRMVDGTWNSYFYVDDGSSLFDGNTDGYLGIRCRAAGNNDTGHLGWLPNVGDKVSVTGVMGLATINGKIARYFWTWDYLGY